MTVPQVDVQVAVPGRPPGLPVPARVRAWACAAMDGDDRALCVRLVGRRESAVLNGRFRGRRGATNVLAFAARQAGVLGDVAVCAPLAASEAASQGKTPQDHVAHLVVHGVLHLLGMGHDTEPAARIMEAREVEVLAGFGIADPYRAAA